MIDIATDVSLFYADFGISVPVAGKADIVAMVDETLELDDSDGMTLRTLSGSLVEQRDTLTVNGRAYRVMRVTPYGDSEEEKILTLKKEQ